MRMINLVAILLVLSVSCGSQSILVENKEVANDKIYVYNGTTGTGEIMLYSEYTKLISSPDVTVLESSLAGIYDKLNKEQRDEYTLHIATELTKRVRK